MSLRPRSQRYCESCVKFQPITEFRTFTRKGYKVFALRCKDCERKEALAIAGFEKRKANPVITCAGCGRTLKAKKHFTKNNQTATGWQDQCKECVRGYRSDDYFHTLAHERIITMNKTYTYDCEYCGHHKQVSEVEAYRTGAHTKCNKCGEVVTIYINFKPGRN